MAKRLILWREPKRAEEQKTRGAILSERRWQIFFAVLVIAVMLYYIFVLHNIFGAMILPTTLGVMFFLDRVKPTYIFEENGICYETGMARERWKWKDIESWFVLPEGEQANLKYVVFMLKTGRKKRFVPMFLFDVCNEERIRAVLHDKLPGKEISRLTGKAIFESEMLN